MKKVALLGFVFLPLFYACSNNSDGITGKPENDVDAARMFIRSALDGRWKEARKLIVPDSANIEDLEVAERNYTERMNAMDQRGYREAQITIHDTRKINDSASVIIYSNTFKKERDSIKAINLNGDWLVDLKYSFPNNHQQ
ncbi:MAG: hypothetical protein JWR72_4170 [Flavisolibacter sp.]|jgi:hypothetical protein|nr:hypothetical protein [Flavisolibacter sp.]